MRTYEYLQIAGVGAIVIAVVFSAAGVSAQSAPIQLFTTWNASNFYPASFEGKALPSAGTGTTVAVEAARSGALLDLSQYDISWRLDGKFLAAGKGLKQTRFTASKGAGDSHFVQISAVRNGETVETSLRIPAAAPTAVIDTPYPENTGRGGTVTIHALPFFFNVNLISDLSFSWLIGGERRSTGSDNTLTISGGAALATEAIAAGLEVQNVKNPQEIATARNTFSIAP